MSLSKYTFLVSNLLTGNVISTVEFNAFNWEEVYKGSGVAQATMLYDTPSANNDVLKDWTNAVWVVKEGTIVWGGIMGKVQRRGGTKTINVPIKGFFEYLNARHLRCTQGMTYAQYTNVTDITWTQVDPFHIVKDCVDHIQSYQDGNLHLGVTWDALVGKPVDLSFNKTALKNVGTLITELSDRLETGFEFESTFRWEGNNPRCDFHLTHPMISRACDYVLLHQPESKITVAKPMIKGVSLDGSPTSIVTAGDLTSVTGDLEVAATLRLPNWVPGQQELTLSIDNNPPVLITDDPSHIPDWPMELTIQLDAWSNTPPSSPVIMQVDYVLLREYDPDTHELINVATYFNQFDTVGPAATVLGPEWEIYDSVGNAGFGIRSPGQVEVVAEATATSGSNVLQITAEALPLGTGTWSVIDGKLIDTNGDEYLAAGFNGGVRIGVNGFSDAGNSEDEAVVYAWDRMPGNYSLLVDVFPGDTNVIAAEEVFPGGTVSGGLNWSSADLSFVTLPDRVYALTGQRSAAAIAAGIDAPADHWHSPLYRVCAFPRPAGPTWNGADHMTPDRTIPQYVARARELVNLGLVVSMQDHSLTGADPVMPAAAVSNPLIDPDDAAFGAVYPVPYDRWGTQPTGAQRLRDSLKFYDAIVAEFTGDENLWIGLPNEFYTGGRTTASDDVIVTMVRRIRAQGWTGIINIPTGRYAGDLAGLSRGEYDTLMDRLELHGVGNNITWEWHNYGANYPTLGSPTNEVYTYAATEAQLLACKNGVSGSGRKYAVWMAEYGQATPVGTGAAGNDAWNREAVLIMATNTYGQPLGEKYPNICPAWWGLGDNSFDWSYALTYGAANKGNESGPDPNSTGTNPGTYPWWDVTTTALRDEWLTPGGRSHWDLAHSISTIVPDPSPDVHYSGGLKLLVPQTYGQYELRVRVADDPTEVTSGVVLLWPEDDQWPEKSEVDWWETFNNRDTRTPTSTYVHRLNPAATPPYDASDDEVVATVDHIGIDQSDWHKIVGSWTPGTGVRTIRKKWGDAGNRSWRLQLLPDGRLRLEWSPDGTTIMQEDSDYPVTFANDAIGTVRVALDVDDGAGDYDIEFFESDNHGFTWSSLTAPPANTFNDTFGDSF